ncbi:MAG: pyridoxal-dependent decarboxylase [Longimicrobiales bacterium]|nr:pyridoxal-dependent decarboxylase [Longimicrobiales bacterium]
MHLPPMTDDFDFVQPYFLGPAAENDQLLEQLVVEFLRDHAYWRRNFHPEDGLRISAGARHGAEFLEVQARTRAELHRLSADLKRAVPFFHPRYVGHMSADLLIPGLVARLITTLYNPNNVSEEAAPVTLEMELEAGEQLARMFGYSVDGSCEPCAWGHLTSGGTVANYEALWNFRSVKFYALALQEGAQARGFDPVVGPAAKPLSAYTKWELLNLSVDQTIAMRREMVEVLRRGASRTEFHDFSRAVRSERIEHLGTAGFFLKHQVNPPRVLVSASAHYSWAKGMKVLGLGTANLVQVRVDDHMRMDPDHLEALLAASVAEEVPVLCVVGMLGTTEFGTVDPVHHIVAARARWRERGVDFGIHVDAAWGGYLTSVFRRPDGTLHTREEVAAEGFRHFPSDTVYRAFAALPETDSITVDPHKLGYIPYSAGAFVARNREVVDFITQEAAYVFDLGDQEREIPRRQKLRNLGQYILEGSKPGAAAAAVAVTHRVLPLDSTGFGRLLRVTVQACETFYDSVREIAERWRDRVHVCVPFEPDSNLICIALNPTGNASVAAMNRFARAVFQRMKVDPRQPVQLKTFIGSYTSLTKGNLPGRQADRILAGLRLDPATFQRIPEDPERDADHLFILRHTLMNPWLLASPRQDGRSYIDLYWDYLEGVVREVLEDGAWRAGAAAAGS